jgi:hypothetical protein
MTLRASLGFEATKHINSIAWGHETCGVDRWGRLWNRFRLQLDCVDQTGTSAASYDISDLSSEIPTYITANQVGSTWGGTGGSDSWYRVFTFDDVSYLLTIGRWNAGGLNYRHALCIYTINEDATLTISGVTWVAAPQYSNLSSNTIARADIDICGDKAITDPLYVWLQVGDGDAYGYGMPSIATILGSCAPVPTYVRQDYEGAGADYAGTLASATFKVFTMPGAAGVTMLCAYVSKEKMADIDTAGSPVWLDALAATYPDGVMLATDHGVISEPALGSTLNNPSLSSITPTVDAGAFSISAVSYDGFPNTGLDFDGVGDHASNDYLSSPSILSSAGGTVEVAWVQPYQSDGSYVGGHWDALARVRLMTYSASTGVYTQTFEAAGPYASIDDINQAINNVPNDTLGSRSAAVFWYAGILKTWFAGTPSAGSSARDFLWLAHFSRSARRVMSFVRIGKP